MLPFEPPYSPMSHGISISVILATTDAGPDLDRCLDVLEPQVAAAYGEIIVGDGHGAAFDQRRASDRVRCIRIPGASVFELRARGVEAARGDVVAITEDHCVVGADWCAQILEAFKANPDAMAVSGPVLNGSTDRLIDWANFVYTFGAFFPPVNRAQRYRCPPAANIAYRRSAVGSGPLAVGWLELELGPRLFFQRAIHTHDAITVTHVQSHGFWGTLRAHFHNGRSTTGLRRAPLARGTLPWKHFASAYRSMSPGTRSAPAVRAALPLVFLLSCCHAAGEVVGSLAGPGNSPARLR